MVFFQNLKNNIIWVFKIKTLLFYTMSHFRHNLYHCASDCAQRGKNLRGTLQNTDSNLQA